MDVTDNKTYSVTAVLKDGEFQVNKFDGGAGEVEIDPPISLNERDKIVEAYQAKAGAKKGGAKKGEAKKDDTEAEAEAESTPPVDATKAEGGKSNKKRYLTKQRRQKQSKKSKQSMKKQKK